MEGHGPEEEHTTSIYQNDMFSKHLVIIFVPLHKLVPALPGAKKLPEMLVNERAHLIKELGVRKYLTFSCKWYICVINPMDPPTPRAHHKRGNGRNVKSQKTGRRYFLPFYRTLIDTLGI